MTTGGSLSQAQSTQKVSRRPRWFALFFELSDLFFELSDPAWFQAGGIALALVMLGALGLLGWGLWHHLILGMPR
jgi:hypothetical protein